MSGFWERVIWEFGAYTLTAGQVCLAVLALAGTWILARVSQRWLNSGQPLERLSRKLANTQGWQWPQILKICIWVVGILTVLAILGVRLQAILDTPLFSLPQKEGEAEVKIVNIVVAILVFIGARLSIWYFYRLFVRLGESKRISLDQGRRLAIYQIFKYLIYGIAIVIILSNLHLNLDLLIASSAALFLGVGLALQRVFEDFASGLIILFEGTVEIGDMVEINELQLEGKVMEIRLRTSVVETPNSVSLIVPNRKFINAHVVNWSFNDRETRFQVAVGVAYGSDVQLVRKVLRGCANSHGLVLANPEPRVRFVNFGDSALEFELLFWTNRTYEYLDIMSDIRFKIDAEFRRHGIQIPFPQRDLHIKHMPVSEPKPEGEEPLQTRGSKQKEK